MASTLSGQYTAATTDAFVQRVEMAMVAAAIAIASETKATGNHGNRVALAAKVLRDPNAYRDQFSLAIAAQGIDDQSTDDQVSATVSAIWDGFAGAG